MSADNASNDEVYFKWLPEYNINIEAIDSQHQELVNMLNRLFDAVSLHEGNKVIGGILEALRSYTETHCSLEERLMQQANFPDLDAHRLEHQKMIEHLDHLCKTHSSEDKPIHFEILRSIKIWLKGHIKSVDAKYNKALQQAALSFSGWESKATEEFNVMAEETGHWWKVW